MNYTPDQTKYPGPARLGLDLAQEVSANIQDTIYTIDNLMNLFMRLQPPLISNPDPSSELLTPSIPHSKQPNTSLHLNPNTSTTLDLNFIFSDHLCFPIPEASLKSLPYSPWPDHHHSRTKFQFSDLTLNLQYYFFYEFNMYIAKCIFGVVMKLK
ncbi:hypothetical protein DFH28DRAFT_923778 [Melampsora americana]|nr:hypothetical protein DFH28DRAFT_923778 [Melampsora americana]